MSNITQVTLFTNTGGSDPTGGTNARVYFGVAGREFHVSSGGNDFEAGQYFNYIFGGDDANVADPVNNNPALPPLTEEHLDAFPVYVRVAAGDTWLVERLVATVTTELGVVYTYDNLSLEGLPNKLWLGDQYGHTVFLHRQQVGTA
jgi:hypothetical protein